MVACRAAMRRVFFSPPPPMRNGNVARRWGIEAVEAFFDDRQVSVQLVQTLAGGAELVAVFVVIALGPSGTDAEDKTTARNVIHMVQHSK